MKSNYGRCNICGETRKLTDDHVPPQGSWDPDHKGRVWVQKLTSKLGPPDKQIRRISQNGLKFRTLCADCNNKLLGGKYDPALHRFSRKVRTVVRVSERLRLPSYINIDIYPAKVTRAVFGHLLAAELRADMTMPLSQAPMQKAMRDFVLDPHMGCPHELRVFAWPYLAKRQVVLRGVGIVKDVTSHTSSRPLVCDVLKYMPLAFIVTYNASAWWVQELERYEIAVHGCLSEQVRLHAVPTKSNEGIRPSWPESPGPFGALVINSDVCIVADMDDRNY